MKWPVNLVFAIWYAAKVYELWAPNIDGPTKL